MRRDEPKAPYLPPDVDISQYKLLGKITHYLSLLRRDRSFSDKHMSEGFCNGYALYLGHQYYVTYLQPERRTTENLYQSCIDDMVTIAQWSPPDIRKSVPLARRHELIDDAVHGAMERTIQHIFGSHDPDNYMAHSHQFKLTDSIQDTRGHEFTLTNTLLFTPKLSPLAPAVTESEAIATAEEIITEFTDSLALCNLHNKVYLLGIAEHTALVIKINDSCYIYHDSIYAQPTICADLHALATEILLSAARFSRNEALSISELTTRPHALTPKSIETSVALLGRLTITSKTIFRELIVEAITLCSPVLVMQLMSSIESNPMITLNADDLSLSLMEAYTTDDPAFILPLIKHPAYDINHKPSIDNPYEQNPLLVMCQAGAVKLIQCLIKHGADKYVRDKDGLSAIEYLCKNLKSLQRDNSIEAILLLLLDGYRLSPAEELLLNKSATVDHIQAWITYHFNQPADETHTKCVEQLKQALQSHPDGTLAIICRTTPPPMSMHGSLFNPRTASLRTASVSSSECTASVTYDTPS
ncbi:MAG: hypothetical protein P1U34_00850 [Coxiellaceae bacterium]|nr:hypothetical protein [Coxiellaceae bacterium]